MASENEDGGSLTKSQRAQQFHDHFQAQSRAIEDQIAQLHHIDAANTSERADSIERCLAGITRLSAEVKDAAPFLPAYDQRTHSETVRALGEKLETTREAIVPRSRFAFKSSKKTSGKGGQVNVELSRKRLDNRLFSESPTFASSDMSPASTNSPNSDEMTDNLAKPITISKVERTLHKATSVNAESGGGSAAVLDCHYAALDLRQIKGLAALTLRGISKTVVICGHVDGAVHATGLTDCLLLLSCRQLRMHTSKNVQVVLYCASRPIIEDCNGVIFSPLPASIFAGNQTKGDVSDSSNQWDQVDDFRWLKAEASPNFTLAQQSRHGWRQVLEEMDQPDSDQDGTTKRLEQLLNLAGVSG